YAQTTTTLNYIVGQLNTVFPGNTYAYAPFGTSNGDLTGNGPNGLIYNTTTVQVLGGIYAPTTIGTPSSSGAPRTPMRYTLAPKGLNDHSADFTIYVSHAKAGSTDSG